LIRINKQKFRGIKNLKNILLRKSLVSIVVIIFIGMSFTSSIHAYTGEIINQSTDQDPGNFSLNDDYINGFWKFDEGNGNTAYDSSGHDYDGIINGASWTSGHSSYALDFDGTNDYVKLDDYAKDFLGFNKTDDMVFSLYFKTTQNTGGVMYSVSAPDYNPGHHIAMNANGTLEFRAWRLSCGITLTSKDSYNDGDWHHVEVWYNGMAANPLVDMYVDGELDNSIEYYVCQFSANQFTKAKIGTRSNDSEFFFDGAIDEVKVIKYPGGNQQNPPIISGPNVGQPDIEYEFTFEINDPENDEVQLFIDWDDGTYEEYDEWYQSGDEVVFSHTWTEDDKYEIRAKTQDIWEDSPPSKHVVRIGDQPPEPPEVSGQKYGDTNQDLTYTFKAYDLENDNIKYSIDWGDDDTEETIFYPSNTSIELTHSWTKNDDYNITAIATDIHGKPGDPTVYHIRIGDEPPDPPDIYGEVRGVPDIFYEFGIIAIDPENDNLTYEIDWGDGYIERNIGPFPSGEIIPRSHKWNNTGTYLIKARAKDEFDYFGDWSQYEITVPLNKAFNFHLLDLLFERFPFANLIFKYFQRFIMEGQI
jgi:hypothetical protein